MDHSYEFLIRPPEHRLNIPIIPIGESTAACARMHHLWALWVCYNDEITSSHINLTLSLKSCM